MIKRVKLLFNGFFNQIKTAFETNLDGLFDLNLIINESSVTDKNYHMTVYFQKYRYKL